MSKLKAALLSLLIGTSSVAIAAPTLSFDMHRDEQAPMPVNQWTSWISLGAPMSLLDGKDVIRPAANLNITQVRLQASNGLSYVQKVTVKFHDGSRQTFALNRWLTTRAPMLQLDLAATHRGVDSITVLGTTTGPNASYEVFAQGAAARVHRR
jgi:hypothetical protein